MFGNCKLGLKAHDPVRVAAVKALHDLLPPDVLISNTPKDWALGRVWDTDPLGNNDRGNCGPVACVNVLNLVADVAGSPLVFTEQDADDAYRALGWDGTDATDNGVVLLDLMDLWQRDGIGGLVLDCFFRVGFLDQSHLLTALCLGGPLVAGFTLTESCKTTDVWDDKVADDPRIWGGHAVAIHAGSPGLLRGKSWGYPVDITPGFLAKRCNEAYLPACEHLRVPSGIDYLGLLQLAGKL